MAAEDDAAPVKAVQAQAGRALRLALLFAIGAAGTVVVPHRTGAWLPLHLFLVGALLLAISGATRLLAVTWSAGVPSGDGIVGAQRWSLAIGAAGLAVARERDLSTGLTAAFGLLVTTGLLLLGILLATEARTSRVLRFRPAVAFYLVAVTAGVVGTLLGAAMVTGRAGIRDAHVIVNLLGLVGLVIAGTLPFFTATQARMKMSGRATPPRLHGVLGALAASVALAAGASIADRPVPVAIGLAAYSGALVYLATLLPRPGRKQLDWAGPRLVQLALGLLWWVVLVATAAVRAATGSVPLPERLVVAVVLGGYLPILVASLAYLGPVLRGGGHVRLGAGFATTRSWASLVAGNAAAVAWLFGLDRVTALAVVIVAADVAVRALRLARPQGWGGAGGASSSSKSSSSASQRRQSSPGS